MPKTGATRYQKFLKSEKSKTKLKAKKELPKGTNVTKTNFKVKKIVIKDQLKKHIENEALSSRKLNVKELLSRLNHFNTHSRTDALNGLKEVVSSHPEVLEQNLGQLINGIIPMVLNIEKSVRQVSFKVLHLILSNVSTEKIEPFFDIMSIYLRSAMTHIDSRIQEDSLQFLDILLLCAPEMMANDFHKIVPNFLDMISKLRVNSKPGRVLTVNLDSQITSVTWRGEVLHRLQDFLQKFVDYHNINDQNKPKSKITHVFDETKMNYYNLFNPIYISVCSVPCFSSKNKQDVSPINEVEKFTDYIDTLMPLLYETWVETCPSINADKNIESVISVDTAVLLKHIVEVVCLLWNLVHYLDKKHPSSNIEKLFCQKYRQSFTQNIVNSFPYVTNIRTKQYKCNDFALKDTVTDPKMIIENLEICHLFILLNSHINVKSQKKEISSVLNYIEKTFNPNTQNNVNNVLIKIMDTIFSDEVNGWTRTLSVLEPLFRKIILAYFNKEMPKSFRENIFTLLCKIALNERLSHFHSSDAFEEWLKNLPDILLEMSITIQTIDIIHNFAVRNNKVFNAVMKPKLLGIIQNLPFIVVTDSDNDNTGYHKLYSLLFWIKCWDNESLNAMEKQLLDSAYKSDHSKFILDTLRLRSEGL